MFGNFKNQDGYLFAVYGVQNDRGEEISFSSMLGCCESLLENFNGFGAEEKPLFMEFLKTVFSDSMVCGFIDKGSGLKRVKYFFFELAFKIPEGFYIETNFLGVRYLGFGSEVDKFYNIKSGGSFVEILDLL